MYLTAAGRLYYCVPEEGKTRLILAQFYIAYGDTDVAQLTCHLPLWSCIVCVSCLRFDIMQQVYLKSYVKPQ